MPFGKHAGYFNSLGFTQGLLEWFHRQGMPKGKLGMQRTRFMK